MATFNGKKIEIYDLDSIQDIINRLAALENTLPEFIYFPDDKPEDISILQEDVDIQYEDLLNIFKENKTFQEVYDYVNGKNNFSLEEIVYNYVLLNPSLDKMADLELREKRDYVWKDFEDLEKVLKDIDVEYRPYLKQKWEAKISNKIKDAFQINIEENKTKVKNQEKIFKNFNEVHSIDYTKFQLENVKYELELDVKNLSLLEIFNIIKLNPNIPFATTNYFYKILKDFTPYKSWTNLFDKSKSYLDKYKNIDRKTNIIFKVLETQDVSGSIDDYTEVILNVKENIFVKLEHSITKFNISREELTSRMLSILNINDVKNERDIGVKGIFYFPKQSMNKYVMLDLIMNDSLFSNILSVDESTLTIKSHIFIHFTNPRVSNITAYVTLQKVMKKDPNMKRNIKNYDKLFPLNSEYIRVKVSKCESVDQVKYFQNILGKLFVKYNEKKDEILEFYENIAEMEVEEPDYEEPEEDRRLKTIDPNVFRAKYTRYCPRPPTYIEDDKVDEIINRKIITFPNENVGDIFPKKYYCNYTKHIYPGLRVNPYKNADILPYIPCCYTKDQEKVKGSKFRNYYFGEALIEKDKKQQDIYVSNIIIPNDNYGTLPPNINKIFSTVDVDGIYYRKGMFRNKNSFLSCVLQALNINDIEDIKNNESKINRRLSKTRNKFNTDEYAASCKQEMYNYTIEEIKSKIENEDEYFDPKLFIHLLEIKYDCNIFLFSRNNKGELILPKHIKGYYKIKNDKRCVFIYEHMGGESDRAEYPQCELIVRVDDKIIMDYFEYDNAISKNIFNVFDSINDSYIFNKKIKFVDFDIFAKNNIIPVSQAIDTYGKTRMVNVLYNNDISISILTTPLQPFNLPEDDITNINKIDIENGLSFAEELKIEITSQVVDPNNFVKEIRGVFGNINIGIPIEDGTGILENIPISKNLNYPDEYISVIDQYNKFKKLSRYISEYIFWLYSKYLKDEGISEDKNLSPKVLEKFKDVYVEIDPSFVYNDVPKNFDINSGLMKDNKLVLKSEETLKRLFYVLRLYIVRNYTKIMSYSERVTIENYYYDISDFDTYPFQVLLEGEQSVSKWIRERNKKNIIYNNIHLLKRKIQPEGKEKIKEELSISKEPYFFRNKLIGKRIYIAQNTDSFLKAVNISVTWSRDNYNPGSDILEGEEGLQVTLYSFTNNKNIKKYDIEGVENQYNIKIIGYKVEGKSMFTSLLNI